MLTLLPFLSGLAAVWFGILGRRRPCVALWLLTLVFFVAGTQALMTGPLPLSL
ncbi:DUF5993 family protein [Bordetella hinzii]|nr:DUF5993 family protein [Bordetella hinzii]AKQ54868.1 hypothetical protein ACR54_01543 [Bordetella hinzii]AKQ59381.1 hypothetical protein ACR55_01504 [Bordetella hinzii]KCB31793.1 hypothetical protein L543_0779 [Bordetella hinzii L60]KCB44285.1 hypothetical protein L539_0944 [Bordetella hinzii 5132]KCB48072.1 hypothetical protein L538_0814 [Bordetella hinzii 4161]